MKLTRFQNFEFNSKLTVFQCIFGLLFILSNTVVQAETSLNFISFTALPDKSGVELHLTFSGTPPEPKSFTTSTPATISLDLPKVTNNLPWSLPLPVDVGQTNTVRAVEAGGRTRVIINLKRLVKYNTRIQGNSIYVTLNDQLSDRKIAAKQNTRAAEPPPVSRSSGKGAELRDVTFVQLPGDRALITLKFSAPPDKPASFTIDNPSRIALDFPNVVNKLPWRTRNIGIGMARSVTAVDAGGRTRVVLNLVKLLPYETRVEGNTVAVTLKSEAVGQPPPELASSPRAAQANPFSISNIDFRRGEKGEGRIIITMSDPDIPIDTREAGGKIFVNFTNAVLPEHLHQRLDVLDFATPIQYIDTTSSDDQVQMTVTPQGIYEYLAFQSDNTYTIEVKPLTKAEKEGLLGDDTKYTGEKLSLNFQDIQVRAVLQLLADFTGLNMVTSDTVQGSITLRLQNVPWDQALDIVLKTKGLGLRRSGTVIMIAPSEEIAAREKLELESKKQVEDLAQLSSELVQVNYAKATELSELLQSQGNTLLSDRGKVSVDKRTNTLLLLDTPDRLANIRRLVNKLDVPIRQVLIESRVVLASNDFSRELGMRFGVTSVSNVDGNLLVTSGHIGTSASGGTDLMIDSATDPDNTDGRILIGGGSEQAVNNRLNVNLPTAGSAGSIAFGFLTNNGLLDLELSALQTEGKGEVISSPKVITANQQEAEIKQGTQIPYLQGSSSGATTVVFKDAVLSLKVTPHITPDDRVRMDLTVTKDSIGELIQLPGGLGTIPTIDKQEIQTQVLVRSGETIVLGGIYEQEKRENETKIPFLGDIPILGALFRQRSKLELNSELLIFVTPKILKEQTAIK